MRGLFWLWRIKACCNYGRHSPPLWAEFLLSALERCAGGKTEINKLIKSRDYLTACQLIKGRLGQHDWHDLIEDKFSRPVYHPDEIHKAIFNLDLPIVATTNVDKIYDKYLGANHEAAAIIKNYHDDTIGRHIKGDSSTRLVIKVHGSVDDVDKTVFTRLDYADARTKFPNFYDVISALLSTQTFVFIGYSLSDPDINLILEDYSRKFKSPRPHYLVTSDRPSEDLKQMFEMNYSIKILPYSGSNEHIELVDSIKHLADSAQIQRQRMADSLAW